MSTILCPACHKAEDIVAGTGGTLAGVAKYVKELRPDVKVVVADPEGSGLYNKVRLFFPLFLKVLSTDRSSLA